MVGNVCASLKRSRGCLGISMDVYARIVMCTDVSQCQMIFGGDSRCSLMYRDVPHVWDYPEMSGDSCGSLKLSVTF